MVAVMWLRVRCFHYILSPVGWSAATVRASALADLEMAKCGDRASLRYFSREIHFHAGYREDMINIYLIALLEQSRIDVSTPLICLH